MKIKVPFTDLTFYLGKEARAARESLMYGSYQNTFSDMLRGGGFRVDFKTLYSIYNNVVDVNQAVKKLQGATMKEGYRFVNAANEDGVPNATEVNLAESVMGAGRMSFANLVKLAIRDLSVAGNAYWHIEKTLGGKPLRITAVDPRTMVVVADQHGVPQKYIQRVSGHDAQDFDPEEIIHIVVDYSTSNPVLGVSPIEAICFEAKTEMAAQMSNYVFYENNAVPSHLLIIDAELDKDQIKKLKHEMDKQYRGAKNRFKAGIIPYLKDVKTVSPSQKDMQFIESRKFTTKKVVVAFGVDAFILGYTEGIQRGNADVIYKMFYENTIRPLEVLFEGVVNNEVLPRLGISSVKFKINQSNYDNEREKAEITRQDVMSGIITVNEARRTRGLDPSDNELADELMVNGFLLDDLGEETKEVTSAIKMKMEERKKSLSNLLEI